MSRSVVAVAFEPTEKLQRLSVNFGRSFPVIEILRFGELLRAIDEADRQTQPDWDASPIDPTAGTTRSENEMLREQVAQLEARVTELTSLAHIDPLVGLPDRRLFERELANVIARVDRSGGSAAVVFVDVNGLKGINDRFGHPTGDAALVRVAQILVDNVRASDIVARLSGDEFVILMSDADEMSGWNLAFRIIETTLTSQFDIGIDSLSLSVGADKIQPGDQANDVIMRADKAMYRIKSPTTK